MNTWDEAKRAKNLTDHGIDFADLDGFFHGDLLTRANRVFRASVCSMVLSCSWCGRHAASMATLPT